MLIFIFFGVFSYIFWKEQIFIVLCFSCLKMEEEQLKGFIVKKLFHHGYIGGRHTDVENLKKSLPSHVKGEVKKAAQELIQEEILIPKLTSYGLHVSLNPRKREEMDRYLQ